MKLGSSVTFEAPAEQPNLTLVTDSFLQFIYRNINVHITKIYGAKSVMFGELNLPLGA